jgi:hypothetical protein
MPTGAGSSAAATASRRSMEPSATTTPTAAAPLVKRLQRSYEQIIEDANNTSHFGVSGMLSSKLARSTHETSCLYFQDFLF